MAVVVFDSDVLIGFLGRHDAHHAEAVEWMRAALTPGTRRLLCAVNYAEILMGPMRAGAEGRVREMLRNFSIETVPVDEPLAEVAAAVRARRNLKLPDAFAVATAMQAATPGRDDVRLASFDRAVLKAAAEA
jgi:predicted nucleic acid-binding protein